MAIDAWPYEGFRVRFELFMTAAAAEVIRLTVVIDVGNRVSGGNRHAAHWVENL